MFPVYLADRHVQTDIQLPFVGSVLTQFFSLSLFQSRNNVVQVRGCVIICWSNENLKAKSEILIQFFLANRH